ncbi:BgTH12-00883 [Blumeria graminis f. sp. triticale]|uniref:BgTH12-00883 n=1 Tax=Blumeria graminis f. sp. triticale TaxID=1689686 RepID=A0A9W4D7T1_BLUGR|nr:BgTH12-00883 [Blumeria graminis f. sp. triticale]
MSKSFFRRAASNRDSSSIISRRTTDSSDRKNNDSTLYGLGLINGSEKKWKHREPDPTQAFIAEAFLPERSDTSSYAESHAMSSRASSHGTIRPDSDERKRSSNSRNRPGSSVVELMDTQKTRTRRERTFVGSECAVCEEPLEHTLRGERILQFSCGHVSHEACFYEHIKEFELQYCPSCNAPLGLDTSRGGSVLDIEKLTSIVRSVSANESMSILQPPTQPWDNQTIRPSSRDSSAKTLQRGYNMDHENYDSRSRYSLPLKMTHARHDSDHTRPPSVGYPETVMSGPQRRHEYELQAIEPGVTSPVPSINRNPIPPPTVVLRSEFPTLCRSRDQQTLTCLITVEVSESTWRPCLEDTRIVASPIPTPEEKFARPPSPAHSAPRPHPYESPEALYEITESLRQRVENWHGLDFSRFGKLRLHGKIRVGKDKITWQELECFLFAEMLVCVKEKKINSPQWDESNMLPVSTRCTLKGSILIKKHLNEVIEASSGEENVLTLSLSVAELPSFHLQFVNKNQLKLWQQALLDLNAVETVPPQNTENDPSDVDEEDWQRVPRNGIPARQSSVRSYSGNPSVTTDFNVPRNIRIPSMVHAPIDIVVVIPISSSMQGVKISLVRDALKFMVQNLGERDRMGIVTFGSSNGATPLVGMTTSAWNGWSGILSSIRPVGHKSYRVDVVEGANVAMDLLMQRKFNNPIANILLISDSSTSDQETVDFVVSRAEAAKVSIYSFGLGMTHKPDTMVELSTRTKASYMYVKDWMMLRECLAGCLGAMQSTSHQNVKLKLRLPEGSPAKFVKISGALQITKRATGKDAEASLGDLRFGDKRDILVQLVIHPDHNSQDQLPQDPWESIVSGLEALGGPLEKEDDRAMSIEEVPLIQAELSWGDILRDGTMCHSPRPSLLAITMLPAPKVQEKKSSSWPNGNPPIPSHQNVVQRRMELLTSDMLTRALTLVSRGQHDRAQHLLNETRSILKGLGKGGLPPIPPPSTIKSPKIAENPLSSATVMEPQAAPSPTSADTPSPPPITAGSVSNGFSSELFSVGSSIGIDPAIVSALDAEIESSLEWICHPAVFSRDSRKAILQAIGVISSQRGFTFRTPVESSWATRIRGVKLLTERSKDWREESGGEGGIMEES